MSDKPKCETCNDSGYVWPSMAYPPYASLSWDKYECPDCDALDQQVERLRAKLKIVLDAHPGKPPNWKPD